MVDDHNRILESWVDDRASDCCSWYQVECNTITGQVIDLSLSDLLYRSTPILNFSLFQPFEELQSLNLSFNYFKGWVDNSESLKQLKILDLGWNNFNSSILPCLTRLTSLRTLILGGNNLKDFNTKQGAGLANLRNLKFLDLSSNGINGTLQELEGLKQLKILYLSWNNFNSSILPCLTRLTSLKTLILHGNNHKDFNMKQGAGLVNLRNLEFLDLSNNGISGTLQELEICQLKTLIELDLSQNSFEGHLPTCLNNLTNLRALDLSINKLNGNISSAIQNLTSLEYLILELNNFEGLFSFSSLANLSKLEIFRLSTRNRS
ncbi:hypothetical protein ACOSP7_013921 [Xanthoceras sorbifolium]